LYSIYREQMLTSDGEPAEVVGLIRRILDWRIRVENHLGHVDELWPGRDAEIVSLCERIVRLALPKIHDRCSRNPQEITALPPIAQFVRMLGMHVQLELDAAMRCLTFKLVFKSQFHGFPHLAGYPDMDITDQVQATVTLRTPHYPALTSGEGVIDHTDVRITGIPSESGCTYTRTSGPDGFKAAIQWSNLFSNSGGLVTVEWLYYNPGFPPSNEILQCPRSPAIPLNLTWWGAFYILNDFTGSPDYPFKKGGWFVYAGQDPWAKTDQLHNDQDLLETTTFTLTHTPE
jgi:hypothetical protein